MEIKHKRFLLKISGEALAGEQKSGINFEVVRETCEMIKKCVNTGSEIAIVVGGGNFWRGRSSGEMNRVKADNIGMLATVMNAVALQDTLEQIGVDSVVMTAIPFPQIGEYYSPEKAINHLKNKKVVIFGYGTGNAFFSTDTAASLRAAEIEEDGLAHAIELLQQGELGVVEGEEGVDMAHEGCCGIYLLAVDDGEGAIGLCIVFVEGRYDGGIVGACCTQLFPDVAVGESLVQNLTGGSNDMVGDVLQVVGHFNARHIAVIETDVLHVHIG